MTSIDLTIDNGIDPETRARIADGLSRLLADTYTLYLKTHNYHWNVTGPMFTTLHLLFEQHYTEMAIAVDTIAERIRALGSFAPGSYKAYAARTHISEEEDVPAALEMARRLVDGHETVIRTARSLVERCAKASDEATLDLLTQRLQLHEKTAWMLRSLLA